MGGEREGKRERERYGKEKEIGRRERWGEGEREKERDGEERERWGGAREMGRREILRGERD